MAGGLSWQPNLRVHWGPVVAYNSISSTPSEYYPRKFSAGQIVGRDTVNDSNNGALPSERWDLYDYAAFYDLGNVPSIDLDSYRDIARDTCAPLMDTTTPDVGPGGCNSGYYNGDAKMPNNYELECSTCVIFVEGDLTKFPISAWLDVKALIVTGNVDFNAKTESYAATIPDDAQDEYQYNPTATAYWTARGWMNGGTATISQCGMHGFLYAGGDINNAGGGSTIVGAVYVLGSMTTNTFTVYYDADVSNDILVLNATINRISWDDVIVSSY